MILDIISALSLIVLCKTINKIDDELEIKRLIKVGKEMEREVIVDVEYEFIDPQ